MSTHFLVLQPPQCNTSQTSGIIRVHIQYMYSTRGVCVMLFSTVWPNDRSSFPKWPASDWSIYRHPNSWLLTPETVLISTALFSREGPHFSQQVQVPAYCERHLCIKHRTLKKAQVKIVWQNVPTALSMKSLVAANKWHTYLARRLTTIKKVVPLGWGLAIAQRLGWPLRLPQMWVTRVQNFCYMGVCVRAYPLSVH